ncbi:MAG: patatin family protein [Prevotella sp.]|nr:patatin family protein [Prevotella sp.]
MKKGLVLEGGGLRGMFTSGVIDALLEDGVTFDGMIGVSAGALFGCNFKSGQKGRALRYNIQLKNDPRYMGIRPLLKTGNIVSADFSYHVVPFDIDPFDAEAFRENPMDFWLVATDIETGEPVYHQMKEFNHEEMEWMRATSSMPAVSHPVEIDGMMLLDGGMIDAIPLKAFQQKGYERNVVVLTQPRSYYKTRSRSLIWIIRKLTKKYPLVADIMARRHEMYNAELEYIAQQEKEGNALLIYPEKPLRIGRTELSEKKMRRVHRQGYDVAKSMMAQIREFLNNC